MTHRILAIDDHVETLDIVVLTLKRYGYDVVSSLSPKKGLQLAKETQPDLILLDMNMPDMDGLEVCRRLRADPTLSNVPVIMFTAEDEPYQKMAGFDAGADDYLTKPTDPEEMIARIEDILGNIDEPVNMGKTQAVQLSPPSDKTVVMPSERGKPEPDSAHGGLIAVLGVRGGAGTTLTAINLAASIARLEIPTTLIDVDLVQGHISLYLNQHLSGGSISTLAEIGDGIVESWLSEQMIGLGRTLRLLPAHPNQDGRYPPLAASQTHLLLDILMQPGRFVVADIGRGDTDAQQVILEQADQVLVCLPPERVGLSAAKLVLQQLKNDLLPTATLNALIFDIGGKMNLPRKAIESYLGYPIQGVIAIKPEELTQSVNKGSILVGEYAQGKTAKLFYQLAKQLVQI